METFVCILNTETQWLARYLTILKCYFSVDILWKDIHKQEFINMRWNNILVR